MRAIIVFSLLTVLQCSLAIHYGHDRSGNPDEVLYLPGYGSSFKFRHYSGYLNATNGRQLHYWFVESQGNPTTDPMVLWMNGGPGCSSLEGFLTEHGPFIVQPGGNKLLNNPFSWNKVANVLYLEAPAGVGFSYSADKNYTTGDNQVSLDNYVALQSFFHKFPKFQANDFYVTGESYGGIYVPTLTARIFNGAFPMKLKGFAVGNGMSSYPLNDNSVIFFGYHHGLFGKRLWFNITQHCCVGGVSQDTCNFHNNTDKRCQSELAKASALMFSTGINPYNIYSDCASSSKFARLRVDMKNLFRFYQFQLGSPDQATDNSIDIDDSPPCVSDVDVAGYLNRGDVRKSLHIPSQVQAWDICSNDVGSHYKTEYTTMRDQYLLLLKNGIRALVYNGDVDMMCNFLGDQWFVESLGIKVTEEYRVWRIGEKLSQVGGFTTTFENLSYVTIKGSGHMVPTDKPAQALYMFTQFLQNKPL